MKDKKRKIHRCLKFRENLALKIGIIVLGKKVTILRVFCYSLNGLGFTQKWNILQFPKIAGNCRIGFVPPPPYPPSNIFVKKSKKKKKKMDTKGCFWL